MRILLTGATGFVGRHIASHLCEQGHDVIGVSLGSEVLPAGGGFIELRLDIGKFDEVKVVAAQLPYCDALIHAAAALDMDLFSPNILHTNCSGVHNMLWLASQWYGCRFIFLSSLPVVGLPLVLPITETHPIAPVTTYHASKLFGEILVGLAKNHGVNGVSLRLTAPVGPGMPRNRLLPTLISNALENIPLELNGSGMRKQNYIDVRDIVRAVEICLDQNASGVFNIASASCISNKALAQHCIEYCNSSSNIVFNGKEDPEEALTWDVSIEKAREILGFIPQFNIDHSIATVLAEIKKR